MDQAVTGRPRPPGFPVSGASGRDHQLRSVCPDVVACEDGGLGGRAVSACEARGPRPELILPGLGGGAGRAVRSLGHRPGEGRGAGAPERRLNRVWGVRMATVYVSSTVADLTEERRAVLDWLRLARHQAVDSYLPDSDTVRDSCLEDVAGCDLYVLIAGHRYGFQPPEDNPEGLSITHLEFRRAGECGIPRVALLRTSVPDVRTSDLQDPARAPLVLGFRDEVASRVRPAEFSDLKGLIQGLSTGIQGALAKLDKRDQGQAGPGAAGLALRLAPRPVFLAGREELLAELDARLARRMTAPGRGWRSLCGLGGAGKTSVAIEYAHRHLAEVGVCWQFPAEDPAVLAAEFARAGRPAGGAGGGGPAGSGGVGACGAGPGRRPGGWWCSTTCRTGRRWRGSCRPPGRAGC